MKKPLYNQEERDAMNMVPDNLLGALLVSQMNIYKLLRRIGRRSFLFLLFLNAIFFIVLFPLLVFTYEKSVLEEYRNSLVFRMDRIIQLEKRRQHG
jgi:predicted ABC-type exoprotein transport system permease subunit